MERSIETALGSAGDFAGAAVWRRACRDLVQGLRIVVAGTDGEATARLARKLRTALPNVIWLTVVPDDPAEAPARPAIGIEDAVLGSHALVWATPVTAALGSAERSLLAALEASAPEDRAVVLADSDLLPRLSDEPEKERTQVRERLATIAPEGWKTLDESEAVAWAQGLEARQPSITRLRRTDIARHLLRDARERNAEALREAEAAEKRCDELLVAEDAALEEARRHGERIAAHLLAAMRRRTEALLVDLRAFLSELEADLPAQVDAVADTAVVRRVLPHWLDHVVESWMSRHLADWRAGVLIDIAEVRIADEETRRAELLPPALHPAPLRSPSEWSRRLGLTLALGAGAALTVVGLWAPGLLLASGGLAWSAWRRGDRSSEARGDVVESARGAVRRMAGDAERTLQEQLAQIEAEVGSLGDVRAQEAEAARAEMRTQILAQRATYRARGEELRQIRDALAVRLEAIAAESA